ncbi:hypothetical protein [Pyrobaculum aerophilum]|uniref:Uncharacterized protein n=1 Tax=Pyrobaculum aerophilum TaxID=13773 RepID=A0A371QZJ1_9CREN|nr:hypothetical protein [Pyrobaculum aerophilum]RFA96186.1 hypothetical protein CGL51_05850 [Pyrobaculum aerophilum]
MARRLELELGIIEPDEEIKKALEKVEYLEKRLREEPAVTPTTAPAEGGEKEGAGRIEVVKSEETTAAGAGRNVSIEEVCQLARALSESFGAYAVYAYLKKAKDHPALLQAQYA